MLITEEKNKPSLGMRIEKAKIDDLDGLLREIASEKSESKKSLYVASLARALGLNKSSIEKDLRKIEESFRPELKAVFPELVDLCLGDCGEVKYIISDGGNIREESSWTTKDGALYEPPSRKHLNFGLVTYKQFADSFEGSDKELFNDLVDYLKRFSYLPDEVWPILVFSIFLSYLQDHPDVRYIPVIYFYAVAERGKSRTAKSMLSVAYRGVHLLDLSPANIFRYSQHLKATLFFDCTDLWKTAEKSSCADILLGRFEKGTSVSRVLNPDRGAFEDQSHFEIYGSTIVATNEPSNPIFESRCLTITMPNKPGEYEDPTPEKGLPLKARLTAWRAKMMGKELPRVDKPVGIDGRLWDISKPLFQLCELICPDVRVSMENVLRDMAGQKFEDKKQTIEGRIVKAICDLVSFEGVFEDEIPVEKIKEKLNLGVETRYHVNPQKLGKRMKSLSLRTRKVNGYSHLLINKTELKLLQGQYGLLLESESVGESNGELSAVQVFENKQERRVVESGRELQDSQPHIYKTNTPLAQEDPTIRNLVTCNNTSNKKPVVRWRSRPNN